MKLGHIAFLITSLCLLTHSHANAQVCTPVPTGIVGWWPGNGNAIDSVTGAAAQLIGDVTFAPATVGQGFKFDGFGDAVQIADSPALKPARVSAEAWVRFDSLDTPIVSTFGSAGLQYIVFKKNTRVFNFEGYSLHKERSFGVDRLVFRVTGASGFGNIAFSSTPVSVGVVYHVVGTYDGAAVRVYVNGVLEGQAATAISLDYDTRPVFLGTSGETVFDGKINGIIDEASIYNRALTDSEVFALYDAGPAGKCGSVNGLLMNLAQTIQSFNLSQGIANSFDSKLENVMAAIDAANRGDSPSACNVLGAFINHASAQSGKALTTGQAAQLMATAQQARTLLECR